MVGTQAPQKLFGDFPAAASQIPGMVTPNITAAMPSNVDWGDVAAALGLQQKMKADSANAWAQAAAINSARAAQSSAPQEHYLPSTASQTSGMGYGQNTSGMQNPVLWAPRNLQGPQLGTWADQQQKRAVAENRQMPVVVQAHTGDPYSPNEIGGMPTSGRGLYGPGLTSPMGGANPAVWARMWGGGGSGGRTRQGSAPGLFSDESLQKRTEGRIPRQTSSGPQYQYDLFGGR
jgi:hypothetical protein